MKSFRLPTIILVLLYAWFLGSWAWSGSHLPERVATHFNGSGEADGWMSRSGNQGFMLVFGFLFPSFVVALSYAARFLPSAMINVPHRDYWLAFERRKQTSDYLVRHSLWFACLALCFVIGVQYSIVQANQHTPPQLSTPMLLAIVGLFLLGTTVWVITLLRHFSRIPGAEP